MGAGFDRFGSGNDLVGQYLGLVRQHVGLFTRLYLALLPSGFVASPLLVAAALGKAAGRPGLILLGVQDYSLRIALTGE